VKLICIEEQVLWNAPRFLLVEHEYGGHEFTIKTKSSRKADASKRHAVHTAEDLRTSTRINVAVIQFNRLNVESN